MIETGERKDRIGEMSLLNRIKSLSDQIEPFQRSRCVAEQVAYDTMSNGDWARQPSSGLWTATQGASLTRDCKLAPARKFKISTKNCKASYSTRILPVFGENSSQLNVHKLFTLKNMKVHQETEQ